MNNKLNVLIVHNYYQIPGGEDSVVANEMKLLQEHQHNVILYSRHNSELRKYGVFKKMLLPFTTIFNFQTYREIKSIIKKNSIDIVHVHNTLNLVSPSVYYAALACKVPVVQTIHNFRLICPGATFYRDGHICEDCLTGGMSRAIRFKCYRNSRIQTLGCVLNMTIHKLTGVFGKINYICLTEFNKKKICSCKQIKAEKVYIKPNFVENSLPFIPAEKRKDQYVFAGRLDKLKGIDILFKAWEKLDNMESKLIVCGTGPMETWCKEFIQEHKCNIEMIGYVTNENVRKIVSESKALILPTQWYEGFPMSIVEAFSVGTPVIASNIGNVGELVEEGKIGFKFFQGGLENAIEKMNRASGEMYNQVYKLYLDEYSKKRNYEILMDIYQKAKK